VVCFSPVMLNLFQHLPIAIRYVILYIVIPDVCFRCPYRIVVRPFLVIPGLDPGSPPLRRISSRPYPADLWSSLVSTISSPARDDILLTGGECAAGTQPPVGCDSLC
jgi:hypothetical protein